MKNKALPILVVLLLPILLRAEEYTFEQYKCSMTLPEGWSQVTPDQQNPKGFSFFATNVEDGKSFAMMIFPISKDVTAYDPDIVEGIHDGIKDRPDAQMTFVRGDHTTFKDQLAYVSQITIQKYGDTVWSSTVMLTANGYSYSLTCVSPDSMSVDDPEIQSVLNGFNFIGKPEQHDPSGEGGVDSYHLGRLIGKVLTFGLLIGVPIFLIYRAKWGRRDDDR